jgi:Tfp pilus assembly protein PilX
MMNQSNRQQSGFVSIIAATVLMVLVSVVAIGFSVLMQREQRQALDRQLSSQAFYAAETAVNDVYNQIQLGNLAAATLTEKTECDVSDPLWNNGVIDSTGSGDVVSYSCLKYDQTPTDLVYTDAITTERSKIFPVEAAQSGTRVNSITFAWNGPGGSTSYHSTSGNCSTSALPANFNAGNVPMLRLDIIEVPDGTFDRETLVNRTANLYLYPRQCGGTTPVNFGNVIGNNSGQVINTRCNSDGCTKRINLGGASTSRYIVRVKGVYTDVGTLQVTATGTGTPPFEFKNAQTIVDATGKANDVLQRIEARISNKPNYNWPEAVLETDEGFCKELSIVRGGPTPAFNVNCY